MRRFSVWALVAVLTLGTGLAAVAGPGHDHGHGHDKAEVKGKVAMSGWFSDEWCGAKNANSEGMGCAKSCIEKGAAVVFVSDGKVYRIATADQKRAAEHIGHEVAVEGSIGEDGVLKLEKVEAAGKA